MEVITFYFLVSLIPILWIWSIVILKKWKYILYYAVVNTLVIGLYFLFIFYSNTSFFDVDPYGLKKVFSFLFMIGFHTTLGFIFALYYKYKISKNVNK